MDETGMGCASRTKEPDSNRTESLGAGLEIQLGSRKSRRRRGRMGDAKNWRLNKERQSLKERRVRVESAEREGGPQPQHGQTRREERQWAASVQRQRSVQSSPMRKKNGLRLCDQDVGQRKTEGMCDHGPIKTRLCTAKHWGGERAEEGGRADFRAATVLFHCPASNGSCPRRDQAWGPVRGKWKADGGGSSPGSWCGRRWPSKERAQAGAPLCTQVGCSAA
jgi:hypothetical protein